MGINPRPPLESLGDWLFIYLLMIDVLNNNLSFSNVITVIKNKN